MWLGSGLKWENLNVGDALPSILPLGCKPDDMENRTTVNPLS